MTEYQVTFWRDLPSLVVARQSEGVVKSQLSPRFQEAIDEAAMRLGEVGSDDYLAGWRRGDWTPAAGGPNDVVERVVRQLEEAWPGPALAAYLDALSSQDQP